MGTQAKKSGKTKKEIRTFTYYIPAPPHRKSGYREKEFDKIMNGIIGSGFEILELHTESVTGGMFVLALISPINKKSSKLDENLDIQDLFKLSHSHSLPDLELDENR